MATLTMRRAAELLESNFYDVIVKMSGKPFTELVLHGEYINLMGLGEPEILALFSLMIKLNIITLRCVRVSFSTLYLPSVEFRNSIKDCHCLRNIHLENCEEAEAFVSLMATRCSRLKTICTINRSGGYPNNLLQIISDLSDSFKNTYALLYFDLSSVKALANDVKNGRDPWLGKAAIQAGDYNDKIACVIKRNAAGYAKCRRAIYEFLLIKQSRVCPLFEYINRDVVQLIARMVHESRGTVIWVNAS